MREVNQDSPKGRRIGGLRLLLGLFLVLFLVPLIVSAGMQFNAVEAAGEKESLSSFPGFRLPGFAEPEALYDNALFGERDVTVVNFFGSWCAPCRIEHPILMELASRGVEIVGINYMDDPAEAKAYLEADGNPYSLVLADVGGALDVPLQIEGIPKTFVVNRGGDIVLRIDGRLREPYLTQDLVPLVLAGVTATVQSTAPSSRSDVMEWNTGLVLVLISVGGIVVFLFRTRSAVIRNGTGLRHRMSKSQAGTLVALLLAGVGGTFLLSGTETPSVSTAEIDLDEVAAELDALGGGSQGDYYAADVTRPETMTMESAISRLTKRLKDNPHDVEGWVLLARSHKSVGDSDAAIKAFEEAVRQVPDNVELLLYYGEALMAATGEGGLSDKTKKAFAQAVEIAPEHPGARYYQALVPYLDGDVELARTRWLEMAKSAPADAPWLPTVQSMLDRTAADLGIEAQ